MMIYDWIIGDNWDIYGPYPLVMTNVAEILMGLNGDFMVCHGIIIHCKGRYPMDPFDETHGNH